MQRPQDVLVALKLVALGIKPWRQLDLANDLGLSQAEVHNALVRLAAANLYDAETRSVRRANLSEFVAHGLMYVYPPEWGPPQRGMPTATAAPVLSHVFDAGEEPPVWPHVDGTARGVALKPLYDTIPFAASKDAALYELLALADAIRAGRARERKIARNLFEMWVPGAR